MSKQQKSKKQNSDNSDSQNDDSNNSQNDQQQDDILNDFIVEDNAQSVEDGSVYRRHDDSDQSDVGKQRLSKKQKKKKKKKQKRKRMKEAESDFDQDDLDVLEQQQQLFGGRLNRLKKRKQPKQKRKYQDQYQSEQADDVQQGFEQDKISQSDAGGRGYRQDSSQDQSRLQQYKNEQGDNIFQPQDQKRHFQQQQDKQIISIDIPQRYYYQIRNYAKIHNKSIEDVIKIFQTQDRNAQAKWIYMKGNFGGIEGNMIPRIKNVLDALHKEKLEIMYIYYYRRKLYSDVLNRKDLLRIYKLDQQWFTFKQQFNKLKDNLVNIIFSFQQMPSLQNMLQRTVDIQKLKYFREFQTFSLLPSDSSKKKSVKNEVIFQVRQRGISDWMKKSQAFLSPDNLCLNLINRSADRKPRNPFCQPRQQFQRILKSTNPQNDKVKFPLLTHENRFQTICHYLELQLFSHPELRQILKQKYYKKLVISTNPTKKGNQDINLYSTYFPVKRIKSKPIYTLKRQVWILACQAEKNDLINIQLKFQWQPSGSQQKNFEIDTVFQSIIKYYIDVSVHKEGQLWNVFRRRVIVGMLTDYFFPAFFKEIKEQLTKQGEQLIINQACSQFRKRLLVTPKSSNANVLAMVLQDKKLGIVFVNQKGQSFSPLQITLSNDKQLKQFAHDQIIKKYIQDFKPNKISIGANSRRAQTLRKAIRQIKNDDDQDQFPYCDLCQYQIPSLVAKQKRLQGSTQQLTVLQAISMARFQINPMMQTLSLWSQNPIQNGILSLNLHPFQSFVNQRNLLQALQLVAVQIVNLVGVNIDYLQEKINNSGRKTLQFLCGFGPRKAYDFYQKIQAQIITNRQQLKQLVSGDLVFQNCSPFFKIETQFHKSLLDKNDKDKKKQKYHKINLLDSTRIPIQWYTLIQSLTLKAIRSSFDMRQRKIYMNYAQETIALVQIFKHPQKVNSIEWIWKRQQNPHFDEKLVRQEINSKFKMPSEEKYDFNNEELFFSLLRQTRQTLKKHMIVTVKIISVTKSKNGNTFLNVVIPENGLFGSIKIHQERSQYQHGNHIKAIIGNLPFQQNYDNRHRQDQKQQQLLKVQMLLNFPHANRDRAEEKQKLHDCFYTCFPQIIKDLHPLIDLERFDLRKQDKPIVQIKQDTLRPMKTQFRKISHKNFKNIAVGPAIELIRNSPIGQFVIRPSSDGPQFLTITWHFFSDISTSAPIYRITSDKDNKIYQSLDEIINLYINPMNTLIQDVISNKKFMPDPVQKIQQTCKLQMNKNPQTFHYFFGCTPQYPQYFILLYLNRDKKAVKQLIKVRNSGLYFHDQVFDNLKDLISWFKVQFKNKEYQSFVKKYSLKK